MKLTTVMIGKPLFPGFPREARMGLGTNKPSGNFTWTPRLRVDKAGRITDHEFGRDPILGSIASTSTVCDVKSIKCTYSNLRTRSANCRQRRLQKIAISISSKPKTEISLGTFRPCGVVNLTDPIAVSVDACVGGCCNFNSFAIALCPPSIRWLPICI